eukprot:gene35439-47637_t
MRCAPNSVEMRPVVGHRKGWRQPAASVTSRRAALICASSAGRNRSNSGCGTGNLGSVLSREISHWRGATVSVSRTCRPSSSVATMLATATAGDDDEMKQRIGHHRSRRGDGWTTIEEPLALVDALTREAIHGRVVLVDCLTLWLSNLMFAERDVEIEAKRLVRFLDVSRYPIVFVSNEVGLGLVPETPLGRAFRDAQGRLNQILAAAVPNVVFIAAGLPLWLKRSQEN